MVVSETGEARPEDVGKHSLMRRTGLPARDLRILDPMLSYPSSILGRERAIVVNLEHVKGIITASEVLMINSSNPLYLRFLQDLHIRLTNQTPSLMSNDMDGEDSRNGSPVRTSEDSDAFQVRADSPKISAEKVTGAPAPKQLPFEFRALETCIESACRCLESEISTLEEEAYPALDELTSQLSTLNLERVRHIKSRLVALSGRVQKVADELEHLLDDDNDMAEMYLTQKLNARLLDQASLKEEYNSECEDNDQSDESNSEKFDKFPGLKLDVEELEMLLEAYFAQTNGILQRLSSLSEYVDDTEDYINIMLDDKRNELLQVAIIFNTLNMIVNAGIVVVGLFGMNIQITLFDGKPRQFWATTGGTFGGCILIFLVCLWWGRKNICSLNRGQLLVITLRIYE
ncbi:Magnesium transporter MRS2-F [Spatholobus suberectus]|nr:Magnesium transporter MRS2-F [Spatholobus suberectus]